MNDSKLPNDKAIGMIPCPLCRKTWIMEDHELVCKECEPIAEVDLLIGEILGNLRLLTEKDISLLSKRSHSLELIRNYFERLMKKIEATSEE